MASVWNFFVIIKIPVKDNNNKKDQKSSQTKLTVYQHRLDFTGRGGPKTLVSDHAIS